MPDKKGTAETAPRWVMVNLPIEDLKRLMTRVKAAEASVGITPLTAEPQRRFFVDTVATRLLVWALEHAPEPLP